MGGLTPLDVANGWTIGQLVALLVDTPETPGGRDPFKPGPGERVISGAEAVEIVRRRKERERSGNTG